MNFSIRRVYEEFPREEFFKKDTPAPRVGMVKTGEGIKVSPSQCFTGVPRPLETSPPEDPT